MVGIVPVNHPAQVASRGPIRDVDDRRTPDELFASLHAEHGFTVDAAASAENAKLPRFWTREDSGLHHPWAAETVWCNPPYSDLPTWVAKARAETRDGGCPKVVMLLPANRTEQGWWHEHIEPFRDRLGSGVRVRFLRRRVAFASADPSAGVRNPPFGCVLVIFTRPERP